MPGAQSEVQFAVVSVSALGDNTLVALVAGKRIRLLSCVLNASGGANTVRLRTAVGGTGLSGQMDLIADDPMVLPFNPAGWCQTTAGQALVLELSAATLVAGMLSYVEVT